MPLGIPNKVDNDGVKIANYRGIGLSEMIYSINKKKKARCSLDLAIHVLEVMQGIIKSSENKKIYNLKTRPPQPEYFDETEINKLI